MEFVKIVFFAILAFATVVSSLGEQTELPPGISKQLYCEGCIATIKELGKALSKRSPPKESDVMNAVEKICANGNFLNYEYSPPKTVKACKLLIERHEEEVENAFTKNTAEKEQEICYRISNACTDVDRTSKPGDLSDIDLSSDGKSDKVTKQVMVDPATGSMKVEETEKVDTKTTKQKEEKSKPKDKKKGKKKSKKEGKTLSKKDKKQKRVKKDKPIKKEKKADKKASDDGIDRLNIDINDPSSLDRVMKQIKDITEKHSEDMAKKKKEEL